MEKEEVTFAGAQESEDDSPPFVCGSWAENGFYFLKWFKKNTKKTKKTKTHPKQKTLWHVKAIWNSHLCP